AAEEEAPEALVKSKVKTSVRKYTQLMHTSPTIIFPKKAYLISTCRALHRANQKRYKQKKKATAPEGTTTSGKRKRRPSLGSTNDRLATWLRPDQSQDHDIRPSLDAKGDEGDSDDEDNDNCVSERACPNGRCKDLEIQWLPIYMSTSRYILSNYTYLAITWRERPLRAKKRTPNTALVQPGRSAQEKVQSLIRTRLAIQLCYTVKHTTYIDVSMPVAASDMIRENVKWLTPVEMVGKVQKAFPNVSVPQFHRAWTEMSELLLAEKLLHEFGDNVDIFKPEDVPEGIKMLCWGMKIAELLRGKVVEISVNATCKC
ncbi:hypothetical protein B0H17DRAFT_1155364, partial [Mycena rosella]